MGQSNHWNDLASQLGAQPAPPPVEQPPAAARPTPPPSRTVPPAKPRTAAPADWTRVAGDLGIDLSTIDVSASQPIAPPPQTRSTPPALPAERSTPRPPRPEAREFSSPPPRQPREEKPQPASNWDSDFDDDATPLESAESSGEASSAPNREEGGDDRPRRRRRRRGGRGRSRRDDREGGEVNRGPQRPAGANDAGGDVGEQRAAFDDDREEFEPATEELGEGQGTLEAPASSEASETGDRPRRRRRRRGRGRRDREAAPRAESREPGDDVDSIELDEAETHVANLYCSDGSHDDASADEDDHDDEHSELDRSHRTVPSWQEAIGMIVTVNMDARSKSPGSRPAHRGRGRSPRGRNGGGGGGRREGGRH